MRTLKELAQEALQVQNACNLSGVAQSFARAMSELGNYTRSSTERNTHPIAVLWSDKIASLTATQDLGNDRVLRAYHEVKVIAGV